MRKGQTLKDLYDGERLYMRNTQILLLMRKI